MADGDDFMRQDESPYSSSAPAPGKTTRTTTRARAVQEPVGGRGGISKNKSRRRSIAVVSVPDEQQQKTRDDPSPGHFTMARDSLDDVPAHTPLKPTVTVADEMGEPRNHVRIATVGSGQPSKPSPKDSDRPIDMPKSGPDNGFEGAGWSSETIPHPHHVPTVRRERESAGKGNAAKIRKHANSISKPNPLSYLDADSPQVTPEGVQRSMKEAAKASQDKSPSPLTNSATLATAGFREDIFDVFGDTDGSGSSPDRSAADAEPKHEIEPRMPGKIKKRSHGVPTDMPPRPNTPYPHPPHPPHAPYPHPEDLTPRGPNTHFIKHLPRTEKLPLSGYELLASRISATNRRGGRHLRPIYRRFEVLNHRILLHLQDEISELEEQLHHLDAADTQGRCLPHGILPASRRAESMSGSELQWHKTDIIWKIGFKLEQYNRVLSSFRETCSLSPPTVADMQRYRGYLATNTPIADVETKFLDMTDDLVCLGDNGDEDVTTEEGETIPTPTSKTDTVDSPLRRRASALSQSDSVFRRQENDQHASTEKEKAKEKEKEDGDADGDGDAGHKHASLKLLVAAAVAIVLPILTFTVIPDFIGRMTVVCLVGMGITGTLIQGKLIGFQATQECCVSVGLYGCVMALLAGMVD